MDFSLNTTTTDASTASDFSENTGCASGACAASASETNACATNDCAREHFIALATGMDSLVLFRKLLDTAPAAALKKLLNTDPNGIPGFVHAYGDFVYALYQETDNLTDFLLRFVLEDENRYMLEKAAGAEVPAVMEKCLAKELAFLQALSRLTSAEVQQAVAYDGFLPDWENREVDFAAEYGQRLATIGLNGYGIFAKYHIFTVHDGALVPVRYPDTQKLSELTGYERERRSLIANTEALLAGKPAANALLYGDAGTGKSSTVKAIANEYRDQGLRLIEVKKNQLYQIPEIVDSLSANPCRFILFIDDLSFSTNDNDFSALKAILEGSVGGHSKNLVVYATSNRRHLIKESVSDREGDDIHFFDTCQELMSLSARFGLTITFQRPEKELYLSIVRALADQYEIELPEAELFSRAEAHAIRAGGRSPRTARQFIEMIKSGVL